MSLRRQAVSGVKWTSVSTVAVTAITFVQLAVLTRLLSHADFGIMSMILTVVGFAQIYAGMGLGGAIVQRQDPTANQLSTLYWANLAVSGVIFLIILASSPLVAIFFRQPRLTSPLIAMSFIFLIIPLGQQFMILLQKNLLFERLAVIEIISAAVRFIVAVTAAFFGKGVFSLVYAQLAFEGVKVFFLLSYGLRRWRPRLHFSIADLKGYLSFGVYEMGAKTTSYLASNIDYLLIGRFLGAEMLGLYTIATNLVIQPVVRLSLILFHVAFPIFAQRQNDDEGLRRGYLEMTELVAFVSFPLLIGLAATSSVAVVAVFGAAWVGAVVLVRLLTVAGMSASISNLTSTLLLAKGRADYSFWMSVVTMLLSTGVLWFAFQFGGAVGAAARSSLNLAFIPFGLYLLWRVVGLRPLVYLKRLLAPLVTSLIMGAVVYGACLALRRVLSPPVCLALLVPLGGAIYVGMWRVWRPAYIPGLWRMVRGREKTEATT